MLATERGEGGGADTDSGGSLSGGEFRGGAVIESATVEDGERSRVSRGHRMGKKCVRWGGSLELPAGEVRFDRGCAG